MPAVSGSPTQLATSAATSNEIAATPDDGFMEGDLACVRSLMPNGMFVLLRSTPPSSFDDVNTIPCYSGQGYWRRLALSNSLVLRFDPNSDKAQSESVMFSKVLTALVPVEIFEFTPPHGSTVRVYVTYELIKDDGSDDYGVDLFAAYRSSPTGVVTERLASTPALEVASAAATAQPTITTDATRIVLSGGAKNGETWIARGLVTITWGTIAP